MRCSKFPRFLKWFQFQVRQKVGTAVIPKSLVTGNISESGPQFSVTKTTQNLAEPGGAVRPLSYVNPSSVVVPETKEDEKEKLRTWEASSNLKRYADGIAGPVL